MENVLLTGISCTKNKVKTPKHEQADTIWFTKELLRSDVNSDVPLTDTQLKAKCEAIAQKLGFLADGRESTKVQGCLVAFREKSKSSSDVDDIAIPEISLSYMQV